MVARFPSWSRRLSLHRKRRGLSPHDPARRHGRRLFRDHRMSDCQSGRREEDEDGQIPLVQVPRWRVLASGCHPHTNNNLFLTVVFFRSMDLMDLPSLKLSRMSRRSCTRISPSTRSTRSSSSLIPWGTSELLP